MSTYAMHVAKTGLNSQQTKMQIIANNLANVNTTGFKSDRANFETLLYQIIRPSGEQTSEDTNLASGFSIGAGTRLLNTSKQHSQGSIISTDNALDIAVEGSGFFRSCCLMGVLATPVMGRLPVLQMGRLLPNQATFYSQKFRYLKV